MRYTGRDIFRFVVAACLFACSVAAFNLFVDPLQLFGPSKYFPPMYTSDDRMQAAGLIQSQDFDAVFMGTSLAVHFRASNISRRLGVRAVKLAMSGSNSKEQSFVLAAALKKKPNLVIWQMDDWIFRDGPDLDAYVPTDYYRRNLKGLSGYLLSLGTARESLGVIAHAIKPLWPYVRPLTWTGTLKFHNDNVDEIGTIPVYYEIAATYNPDSAMKSFAHYQANPNEISAGYDYETMVRNFERDALALIRANPETHFIIYFPPYSILQFVAMRDFSHSTLDLVYLFSAHMAKHLTGFSNVSLHDFREASDITFDLHNYMDLIHHSPLVDNQILSMLQSAQYRVDAGRPTASLERLKSQIEAYKLPEFQFPVSIR